MAIRKVLHFVSFGILLYLLADSFMHFDLAATKNNAMTSMQKMEIDNLQSIDTVKQKAKDYLAEKGYDQQYGARPLNRAIQKYVEDQLAEEILKGALSEGDTILVDHVDGEEVLSFNKKPKEQAIEQ